MRKLTPLLLLLLSVSINAQKCFKGKLEYLEQLKQRPLAVVVLEEDEKQVKKLEKKIAKAKKEKRKEKLKKELKSIKGTVNSFNSIVKSVVPKLWSLNNTENITFITKDKLEELRKNDSNKYAVLDFSPDEAAFMGHGYSVFKINYNLITYGGSENKRSKANFRNHLVNTNYNFPKTRFKNKNQKALVEELKKELENEDTIILSEENVTVTLLLAQEMIKYALEKGEKISFSKYAQKESDKNCKELAGNKVLIQSAIIGSKVYKQFDDYKDKVELVSAKRIKEAILNKENVFIGFPVIKQFVKAKSSLGPIGVTSVNTMDHKMIFNPSTGKIIVFRNAPVPLNYRSFKRKDIEKMFKCN